MNTISNQKPPGSRVIVIDAIDGAGKTTAITAMRKFLEEKDMRSFDVPDFERKHGFLPQATDLAVRSCDLLLAAEPTYSGIGRVIRDELVKTHENRNYSGMSAMHAFALDREILYKRLILPFLSQEPGRWIIQDRGLISSLAYQPLQDAAVTINDIMQLEGNRIELSCAPDILFLLALEPEIAEKRLAGREDKKDDHIFEKSDFQKKLAARYRMSEVLAPYKEAGTNIIEIDASRSPEKVANDLIMHLGDLVLLP